MIISEQFVSFLSQQKSLKNVGGSKTSNTGTSIINTKASQDQFVQSSVFNNVQNVVGFDAPSASTPSTVDTLFSGIVADPTLSYLFSETNMEDSSQVDKFPSSLDKLISHIVDAAEDFFDDNKSVQSSMTKTAVSATDKQKIFVTKQLVSIITTALTSGMQASSLTESKTVDTNIGKLFLSNQGDIFVSKPSIALLTALFGAAATAANTASSSEILQKSIPVIAKLIESVIQAVSVSSDETVSKLKQVLSELKQPVEQVDSTGKQIVSLLNKESLDPKIVEGALSQVKESVLKGVVIQGNTTEIPTVVKHHPLSETIESSAVHRDASAIQTVASVSKDTDVFSLLKNIDSLKNSVEEIKLAFATSSINSEKAFSTLQDLGVFSASSVLPESLAGNNMQSSLLATQMKDGSDLFSILGKIVSFTSSKELSTSLLKHSVTALLPDGTIDGPLKNALSDILQILPQKTETSQERAEFFKGMEKLLKQYKESGDEPVQQKLQQVFKESSVANYIENKELFFPFTLGEISGYFKEEFTDKKSSESEKQQQFSLRLETTNLGAIDVYFDTEDGIGINFVSKNTATRMKLRKEKNQLFKRLNDITDSSITIGVH